MYLSHLIIVNYRSCKLLEVSLLKDVPNIFIGVNDCGKTTLLKSIGLLLDDKPVYHSLKDNSSKKDFSNSPLAEQEFIELLSRLDLPPLAYAGNETVVIGKFSIEENDFSGNVNDYSNHLLWCVERDGNALWLARVFPCNTSSFVTLLLGDDHLNEDESSSKFWGSTATDLNRKIKELEITPNDIENVNRVGRFSNLEKIRAIYSKLRLQKSWDSYKIDREAFPQYRYLDWNSSFDDIKKTAADAMAASIEPHILPLKETARAAARNAETTINNQLTALKDSIADMIPNITDMKTKVFIDVKESITDILINKLNCDGDIHLDLQGDGVKRQIWFALIKAGAMASIEAGATNTRFIWAFDEPETHLYPAAQRQFFDIIKEASHSNVQALISTHSTVFIDKSKLKNIKNVSIHANAYTEYSECQSVDEVFESLELKNSDFLFYDKFLVIEGDTEAHLIPELFQLYCGSTLIDKNIQIINLTGKNKWLEGKKALDNVLRGFKKSEEYVIYLFDTDMRDELGDDVINGRFFFAGIQDIEDSIANSVWISVVKDATEGKVVLKEQVIQDLKNSIPINQKIPSNEKFFKKLERLVKDELSNLMGERVTWDILSPKGSDSSQALLKHITSLDAISPEITLAFDKLLTN